MYRFLKKLSLILPCALSVHTVYADHVLECPSTERLSTYSFGVALPTSYNKPSKSVNVVSVMIEPGENPHAALIMYPIPVAFSENPEIKTHSIINDLFLETHKPVTYHLNSEITIPMCVYSLPGKNNFTAFLFITDYEDNEGQIFTLETSTKTRNKVQLALKFLKLVNLPR